MGGRSVVTSVDGRDVVRSLDCVVVVNSAANQFYPHNIVLKKKIF